MPTSTFASAAKRTVRPTQSPGRHRSSARILAVTAGDPCGVGPELVLQALAARRRFSVPLIIIGALEVFQQRASHCRLPLPSWTVIPYGKPLLDRGRLRFLDVPARVRFKPGKSGKEAGRASLDYLDAAVKLWRDHRVQGLVTAPVTKWAIQKSQPRFIGQTEYLSQATRSKEVAMLFTAEDLRVILLTRHLALRDVSRALTPRKMESTIRVAHRALKEQFGIARPKLVLCGLNPHAGEQGRFGNEEQTRLVPLVSRLRRRGIVLEGPLASDAIFPQASRWDAVICCYHDQALSPFKMIARDSGAQLSAGLPLVRTSPDHGSALDIAGRGVANPGAMIYALDLAGRLVRKVASGFGHPRC